MSTLQIGVVDQDIRKDFDHTAKDGFQAKVRTLVTTHHAGGQVAITAFIESSPLFTRSIGGSRIVRNTTVEAATTEAIKLAAGMSSKNPGAGIPASGQKSVVIWQDMPSGAQDKASLLAEHYRVVLTAEPGALFGPDMNIGEDVQDALSAMPGLLDHVTGLSYAAGGLAIDSTGYTGRALVGALSGWSGTDGLRSAAIQGFGAVGAWAASALLRHHPEIQLVALSNRYGTASAADGLPVEALFEVWSSSESPDEGIRKFATSHPDITWTDDPNHLWTLPCDLLIPAARTGVVRLAEEETENKDAIPVQDWVAASGVKAILQGANAPCTEGAEAWLAEHGVVVFPDFIVNCGGVWGCWAEWYCRTELRAGTIAHEALDEKVHTIIREKVAANIKRVLAETDTRASADRVKVANQAPVAALWKALAGEESEHRRAEVHAEQLKL
ncbi:MAG: glutamate dehydrogenase (NAD(P)+) [Myxococcota bacterium]|jgi:glutamate dehydrogenase (NAD(P)+)